MIQHLFSPCLFCNVNDLSYVSWEHSTLSLLLITALMHLKCLEGRMANCLKLFPSRSFSSNAMSPLQVASLLFILSSSPQCVSLLSMQKEEKLWIYSTLNSQLSEDRYSGHKACPTLITVNLPSVIGHLREAQKSLGYSLLYSSPFLV